MQLTTIPMPGVAPVGIRPAAWTPAPFRPTGSPFMAQPRRRMGQLFGSTSLFNHPAVELAIDAGAISISYLATKQFKGNWRYVAWGTLIASSIKALNDLVRLFTMPGPAPTPPAQPAAAPTAQPAP